VCDHSKAVIKVLPRPLRACGFAPELTDEEVICMTILSPTFKIPHDKDLLSYFAQHSAHFFPKLKERRGFVRQAAALWGVKTLIQKRIVQLHHADRDPVQAVDTMPLPVCVDTRSSRDRCFVGEADYGYCAAKDERYYGFKFGLRVSRCGFITHSPLLDARSLLAARCPLA